MLESRKYPISESKFKELIEPIINSERKKSGRPTKGSHYKFFCGVLYILRTDISWRDPSGRIWELAYNLHKV